jgi:uncharacterized surface protein with fasciclin (FAS1) repeats
MRAKYLAAPSLSIALALAALPQNAVAQASPEGVQITEIGGKKLYSTWNIVQNITASPRHKTLAQALSATGLTNELGGPEIFTILAPTDKAFAAVPRMTSWLMMPANRAALGKVLKLHILPGRLDTNDLFKKIKSGGGKAQLVTLSGEKLTFTETRGNIRVDGAQGSLGFITKPDVEMSNGMMHVVNGLLMPTLP